jgi:hypothetical protein
MSMSIIIVKMQDLSARSLDRNQRSIAPWCGWSMT